jgi:hypothetical protein
MFAEKSRSNIDMLYNTSTIYIQYVLIFFEVHMSKLTTWVLLVVILAFVYPLTVEAHQPYCEFQDLSASSPWTVPDPSVSYAYYANMYPETDVDYFTFEAAADQSVLLQMTIPDIAGQEEFVPMMAVVGPGLDPDQLTDLPDQATIPSGADGALLLPNGDEPEHFFEPFGRQYYWNWQRTLFDVPQEGQYTVIVWHPEAQLGRYTFVVGQREVIGGDFSCLSSFDDYWTLLQPGVDPYRDGYAADSQMATMHDHSQMLNVELDHPEPSVELEVFALNDGSYSLQITTTNFDFAPINAGQDHVPGEGHAHLYIDGEKITRVYDEWLYLASLPENAQELSVGLYSNDHRALAIDGLAITDRVRLEDIELVLAK